MDITDYRARLLPVHITWAKREHMPLIMDIERSSFEYPLFEEEILALLRKRNCIAMIAAYDGQVVGFMIYELLAKKYIMLDFAVHPKFRRQYIGKQMMDKMFSKLDSIKRGSLSTIVRSHNLIAHKFLRAIGMRATKVLYNYYENSDEDSYLFEYNVDGVYVPKLERV